MASVAELAEMCIDQGETIAECFLEGLAPEHLERPGPLDLVDLAERRLPALGVDLYPVDPAAEAEAGEPLPTNAHADCPRRRNGRIAIRMVHSTYQAFTRWRGRLERQGARETYGHELGHLWHCGFQGGLSSDTRIGWRALLSRRSHDRFDPEWQADVIGGSILVPRRTVMMLEPGVPLEHVAAVYDVSAGWLGEHFHNIELNWRHPLRHAAGDEWKWHDAKAWHARLEARLDSAVRVSRS